jgi:hypothetical protein
MLPSETVVVQCSAGQLHGVFSHYFRERVLTASDLPQVNNRRTAQVGSTLWTVSVNPTAGSDWAGGPAMRELRIRPCRICRSDEIYRSLEIYRFPGQSQRPIDGHPVDGIPRVIAVPRAVAAGGQTSAARDRIWRSNAVLRRRRECWRPDLVVGRSEGRTSSEGFI